MGSMLDKTIYEALAIAVVCLTVAFIAATIIVIKHLPHIINSILERLNNK